MSKLINGNEIADEIAKKARIEIRKENLKLKIAVILVGNNPVSLSYISQKEKCSQKAGVGFFLYQFPKKIKEKELKEKIKKISKSCSGLIVQLPLPSNFKTQEILDEVSERKDIDRLSENSLKKFYKQDFFIIPPVTRAVKYILDKNEVTIKGKNVVVVGFGRLVGKPLSFWFSSLGATVSIVNEFTKNPSFYTKKADILISGVGKANLIKGNMVKKGVIAIDVGSKFFKGRIVGDIDKLVHKKALLYTPAVGGIGPITTACLIENLVKLNKKR